VRRIAVGIVSLFTLLALGAGSALAAWWEDKDALYWEGMTRRNKVRFERTWTEGFVRLLAIREGMTILDVGTGTGRYALAFAGLMNGSGRVYATDIAPPLVELLTREARTEGLENLHPVLVTPEGVDGFYGRHRYDLITLFHVSVIHLGKVDYFRQMRRYLNEGGRLIVTYQIKFPPLREGDFVDFADLAGELSREPADSPFRAGLRESTWALIDGRASGKPPAAALRRAIIEDFDAIVTDIKFGSLFAQGMAVREGLSFTAEEKAFADWLLMYLKSKGIYDSAQPFTVDRRNAAVLNRLLLVQRFRRYLSPDVAPPYGNGARGAGIAERLLQAGYELKGIYDDIVPFEITLVFTASGKP